MLSLLYRSKSAGGGKLLLGDSKESKEGEVYLLAGPAEGIMHAIILLSSCGDLCKCTEIGEGYVKLMWYTKLITEYML